MTWGFFLVWDVSGRSLESCVWRGKFRGNNEKSKTQLLK